MARHLLILLIVLSLFLVGLFGPDALAAAILINFDDVANGTNINAQYVGSGITLGCFNGNDAGFNLCSGNAFAMASVLAESAPNVISLTAGLSGTLVDERVGFFKAAFSSPVSFASIDAKPVLLPEHLGPTSNKPFLQAFDSGGHFLAEADYVGDVTLEQYHTLAINRIEGDISFVAFSSFHIAGFTVLGVFDNLDPSAAPRFNFDFARDITQNPVGPQVPEPASLVLFVSGVVGLVGLAHSRRRRK